MADDLTADSSPAAPSSPLSPSDALASASPEALTTWRQTGELPVETPSPEADSTPADAPVEQAAATQDAKPAASSPARKPKADNNADTRKAELAADIHELLQRRAQLRRELDAPPTPPAPRRDAKPAASSAAPDATDPEPDPDDAATYPDGIYDRKFMRDSQQWVARDVLRSERAAAIERHRQSEADTQAFKRLEGFYERVNEAKTEFPDIERRLAAVHITEGSPVDAWVMESPLGVKLLLGPLSNVSEVRRIEALPVIAQVRELVELERSLVPAPAKSISDAPDPPRTLGDRATSPVDAVDRAIRSKDVGAFLEAENRRELGLWKASHAR